MPMCPARFTVLHLAISNRGDACLQISLGFIIRTTFLRNSDKVPFALVCCEEMSKTKSMPWKRFPSGKLVAPDETTELFSVKGF